MKAILKLINACLYILGKIKLVFTISKPQYLVNIKTNEIHDLKNLHKNCHIERMAENNKRYIHSVAKNNLLENKRANGCRWCMPDKDTDIK